MRPGGKQVRYKTPPGVCYIQACKMKPTGRARRCPFHLAKAVQSNRDARRFRTRLGFCFMCMRIPVPGRVRCQKHLDEQKATAAKRAEKRRKARGWKYIKVPVK
jgi:hypothetical protein